MLKFFNLFIELSASKKKMYLNCLRKTNYIIENNIRDEKQIEGILDSLLDIVYDSDVARLYCTLCDYYSKFNKENANIFYKFYEDEINQGNNRKR